MYNQNPYYSDPIELREIKEILAACGRDLSFKIIEPALGTGTYGYAFLTDRGTVVKFTTQRMEVGLAAFILNNPDVHPTLPKIYDLYIWDDCHRYDEPLYVIHREPLADLPLVNEPWFNEVVIDLEHYALRTSEDLTSIAVDILDKSPGDPNDELFFEQLVEFYDWAFQNGLAFNDTAAENWGVRNGTLVIRDLGAFMPGDRHRYW
jgi:hypothetical protein